MRNIASYVLVAFGLWQWVTNNMNTLIGLATFIALIATVVSHFLSALNRRIDNQIKKQTLREATLRAEMAERQKNMEDENRGIFKDEEEL